MAIVVRIDVELAGGRDGDRTRLAREGIEGDVLGILRGRPEALDIRNDRQAGSQRADEVAHHPIRHDARHAAFDHAQRQNIAENS